MAPPWSPPARAPSGCPPSAVPERMEHWAAPAALAPPNAAFPGPRHGARHVHSVRKVILLIVSCPPALSAALHLFSRLSFPTSLHAQPSPLSVRGTPNNPPGRYGLSSLDRASPASRTPASLVVTVRPPAAREYNGRHREARGAQQGTYTSNALLLLGTFFTARAGLYGPTTVAVRALTEAIVVHCPLGQRRRRQYAVMEHPT